MCPEDGGTEYQTSRCHSPKDSKVVPVLN
jgi:hypothetical protein